MHRRIAKLQVLLLCKPTLDFLVAAEPLRLGEALLEALHHAGGDRLLSRLWSRILDLLDLLDPSFFVELNPIGDRVATGAQLASRPASAFCLSSLQQKKHLETALDLGARALCGQALQAVRRAR
jgi:hypothetical protein